MKYYAIKVNNVVLGAHAWNQVTDLWQAICEESERLELAVAEENRAEWESCGGNNIEEFLENALKAGFIDNFDIDEIGDEEDAEEKGYWLNPHPHFESVYEKMDEEEAEEKLTIDWQLHIGIAENGNVYAELEDESVYLKVGEYNYKDDVVSFTPNRARYWEGNETVSEGCEDERLLIDRVFDLMSYCDHFDFDDYSIETDEIEQTLDFYDEEGHHFASLTDADAYDQMRYKLLAGADPVADLWEYDEDEEEEEAND